MRTSQVPFLHSFFIVGNECSLFCAFPGSKFFGFVWSFFFFFYLHSRRSQVWKADTVWSSCRPLHKSPRRHVLSARERDAEKGLGNLSVCPVWAQAFQNAQFSASIYGEKPAADHAPWLLIHVGTLSVIKKKAWRLQANSFYFLQKLGLKNLAIDGFSSEHI